MTENIKRGTYLIPFKTREWKTMDEVIKELNLPTTSDTYFRLSRSIYYYRSKGILVKRDAVRGKHQYYKLSDEVELS